MKRRRRKLDHRELFRFAKTALKKTLFCSARDIFFVFTIQYPFLQLLQLLYVGARLREVVYRGGEGGEEVRHGLPGEEIPLEERQEGRG